MAATATRVALVTGANQGIGFGIAKQLAAHGLTVLVGARDIAKGQAAAETIGANARALQLDVTDAASIERAAQRIRTDYDQLDVLINNAGISRATAGIDDFDEVIKLSNLTRTPVDEMRGVFETNVFGVLAVTQAMLPLVEKSPAGRIVLVGSGAGSLTRHANPANPARAIFGNYSVSKTAAHAVMLAFAIAVQHTNIKVNIACPGFCGTALNNYKGTRTVDEGAREAVRLALLDDDGPTATFSSEDGPIPW